MVHARDFALYDRVICIYYMEPFRRLKINVRIINAQHQLLNVVSEFNRQLSTNIDSYHTLLTI
jgi:hypothetical protein